MDPKTGISYHALTFGTSEYHRFENIMSKRLDGQSLLASHCVERVYEVYNPTLASNFAAQRVIISKRIQTDPGLFCKSDWKNGAYFLSRQRVMAHFEEVAKSFEWNDSRSELPVLAAVHGTTKRVAWQIVETGFASVSALDAGWYGSGMYFTTSVLYSAPYFMTSQNPAVLRCLVNPGNPYPVIEDRHHASKLVGLPVRSGYQSNYVLTSLSGGVHTDLRENVYDEIIIPQESQVMPIYLIEFNFELVRKLVGTFQRTVPSKVATTVTIDDEIPARTIPRSLSSSSSAPAASIVSAASQ